MSNLNLRSFTYFVIEIEFVDFVDDFGIAMCYDPIRPSNHQTTVDALVGYISLYLSLFTIGLRGICLLCKKDMVTISPSSNFPGAYLVPRRSCCSWEGAPSTPSIFYDDEEMSLKNFLKFPEVDVDYVNQNVEASAEHRLVQRRSIATAFEEGSSKRKQFFAAVGSSSRPEGKRRKQDATKRGSFRGSVLPYVEEAYFTHNFLSRLNCPSIQRRLDGLSFDELSNVYDDQALRLAMAGN
nr:hypothetical protein [Tanacetum cinerariifolium]